MTAQIALFNSTGVAIASDTVATITAGQTRKTIPNTPKIWPLGGDHLIAVMHSGSVFMNDTTLDLFVTEWKRTLARPLATVREYAVSFRDWLQRESQLITKETEARLLHLLLDDHFYEIRNRIEYGLMDPPDFENPEEAVAHFITAAQRWLGGLEDIAHVKGDIFSSYDIDLDHKLNVCFEDYDTEEHQDELKNQALQVLRKWQSMPVDSTLAFVGFGQSQFYAQSIQLRLRGRYDNQLVCQLDEEFGAKAGMKGSASTFAQDEAIHGFLRGASFPYLSTANNIFERKIAKLLDVPTNDERIALLLKEVNEELDSFEWERFVKPMLDTVAALPLIGLADLAESLVGIEATRAASSNQPASVGGMIESLVIDRKDGVRWVHRLPTTTISV